MNIFGIAGLPNRFWRSVLNLDGAEKWFFIGVSFGLPAVIVTLVDLYCFTIQTENFGFLVSVFSVFSAFLFAAQISAFTIFRSAISHLENEPTETQAEQDAISERLEQANRQDLKKSLSLGFELVNLAISYLVFNSVVLLGSLIVLVLIGHESEWATKAVTGLMSHFFAVLIFAVGQCHDVFDLGYKDFGKNA